MEKNGAINCNTPCGGCGCKNNNNENLIKLAQKQLDAFPKSAEEADAMEKDLTKDAIEAVRNQSSR